VGFIGALCVLGAPGLGLLIRLKTWGMCSRKRERDISGSRESTAPELEAVLDASYLYSRMLHKSYSPGGALEGSGFYR
jgi:hypothetical protein